MKGALYCGKLNSLGPSIPYRPYPVHKGPFATFGGHLPSHQGTTSEPKQHMCDKDYMTTKNLMQKHNLHDLIHLITLFQQ